MKETDTGLWVHLVCALYTPGIAFGELDKLTQVIYRTSSLLPYFSNPLTTHFRLRCLKCLIIAGEQMHAHFAPILGSAEQEYAFDATQECVGPTFTFHGIMVHSFLVKKFVIVSLLLQCTKRGPAIRNIP